MNLANDGLPKPLANLDDVLVAGDTSEKPFKVFVGHNLGNRVFLLAVPMHEFYSLSEVANDPARDGEMIAQRKLDPAHASKLATYILKGLVSAAIDYREAKSLPPLDSLASILRRMGPQPYLSLQPMVVNIRNCDVNGRDIRGSRMLDTNNETAGFKVFLSQQHVFWVVDGQHRRKALELVFDFLDSIRAGRTYPKKGNLVPFGEGEAVSSEELAAWAECFDKARAFATVSVEVHLGLQVDEERQLFHDLNRLGKKIDTNLALQFDNSNPVNLFIKEQLLEKLALNVSENEIKNWNADEGEISRKDLVSVNSILFLNRTNINGATIQAVEERSEKAYWFWSSVKDIEGFGKPLARQVTVAAQPVVLKAIAKIVFDLSFSNRRPENGDDLTERLLSSLNEIDLSHQNPMWRFYEMSERERIDHGLEGLEAFLPNEESGNRDIGSYQGGVMRFGNKHNDIYPILGDMIRWKAGLPNRHLKAE